MNAYLIAFVIDLNQNYIIDRPFLVAILVWDAARFESFTGGDGDKCCLPEPYIVCLARILPIKWGAFLGLL